MSQDLLSSDLFSNLLRHFHTIRHRWEWVLFLNCCYFSVSSLLEKANKDKKHLSETRKHTQSVRNTQLEAEECSWTYSAKSSTEERKNRWLLLVSRPAKTNTNMPFSLQFENNVAWRLVNIFSASKVTTNIYVFVVMSCISTAQ